MPAGTNAGGQLNLLIFEVVCLIRDPETGDESVFTVSVHPLVVAPALIQYSHPSRTAITRTMTGSQVIRGSRGLLSLHLQGDWGVQATGLASYIGTGEVRAERFVNEVVRMQDAVQKGDVNEAINALTGTPFLKLRMGRYFAQPENCTFGVNFYDLWRGRRFSCVVRSYSDTRQHRRAAASGLISYQMAIDEAGPTITGGLGTAILNAFANAAKTWSDVNRAVESYTTQSLVNSALAVPAITINQLVRSRDAVVGQLSAATALLAGQRSSSNDALSSFLADAAALGRTADEAAAAVGATRQTEADAPRGGNAWSGRNADLPASADVGTLARSAPSPAAFSLAFVAALDQSDVLDDLEDLSEAAAWQAAAGKAFGYSREEYHRILAAGTRSGTAQLTGSQVHVVTAADTPESLEALYGVDFDDVLAWNDLEPDEALVEGTRLEIPTPAAAVGTRQTDDLPVFGSRLGRAAWGADLTVDLAVDEDGGLRVIDGEDALVQGINWLIEDNQDDILTFANALPANALPALEAKVGDLVAQDPRIDSVDSVVAEQDAAGGLTVAVAASVINGGTVDTGRR